MTPAFWFRLPILYCASYQVRREHVMGSYPHFHTRVMLNKQLMGSLSVLKLTLQTLSQFSDLELGCITSVTGVVNILIC